MFRPNLFYVFIYLYAVVMNKKGLQMHFVLTKQSS